MKKIIYLLSMFAFVALLTISCNRDENADRKSTVTATVFHQFVDLKIPPDFNTVKGLQIKESNSNEWITIVGIDGFNFEENFEYLLKLEKTYLVNPPLDLPSRTTYKLLGIISKTAKINQTR